LYGALKSLAYTLHTRRRSCGRDQASFGFGLVLQVAVGEGQFHGHNCTFGTSWVHHKNKHMNTTTNSLVQKLWNYCNVLRDDGMSYGDYVEQLTYLLFLKMADERSAPPYNQPSIVPAAYAWPTLLAAGRRRAV
jgi:hypothetical protein